jgi:predicted transporter
MGLGLGEMLVFMFFMGLGIYIAVKWGTKKAK